MKKTKSLTSIKTVSFLLFVSLSISAFSITRPTFYDRPVGFAAVGGTFAIPTCGSTPSYYVTNDSELSAAKGSNRIIIVAAGEYNTFSISGQQNMSLIGEDGANIKNIPISGSSTKNILIRNIEITRYPNDGLSITGGSNIWIDHCTIGYLATSSNKEVPDGAMDFTSGPDYITVSWCRIQNSWKTGLLGASDTDLAMRKTTYYANYVVNTHQRTPRIRSGYTHVLNCLYENTGWCRPESMTADEFHWQETAAYKDDGEYLTNRRIISLGYGIMAAYKANVIVENNFFLDVRWPICASRPRSEFELKYGDLQSPDINNKTNSGCDACKQFGNAYDDSGLLDSMKIKDSNQSSTLAGTMYAPLGYEYTYNSETRWVIKPTMLNPGGRSIKFDEFNASGTFDPTSYTDYYPSGFTAMTANEAREFVSQYAGAGAIQFCETGAAPTLTSPTNKDQENVNILDPIVFTWGGGATDVKVFDLPTGLTTTKDATNKTLTITGTPTTNSTYTIMTEGGAGDPIIVTGTITSGSVITCISMIKIEITNLSATGTYTLKLYDATGTTVVKTLAKGTFASGNTDFNFSTVGLSSGAYIYKLLSGTSTVVKSGSIDIP